METWSHSCLHFQNNAARNARNRQRCAEVGTNCNYAGNTDYDDRLPEPRNRNRMYDDDLYDDDYYFDNYYFDDDYFDDDYFDDASATNEKKAF